MWYTHCPRVAPEKRQLSTAWAMPIHWRAHRRVRKWQQRDGGFINGNQQTFGAIIGLMACLAYLWLSSGVYTIISGCKTQRYSLVAIQR